ncbi:basic blue protein-like [Telopea speciosissima]|uniref:basic blue protein-like n=1 Tax=Telopea speciosissima TaxID=54955 RepID=UPI001CC69531|nr:basic blue protein-like [Telopea speciosissima]
MAGILGAAALSIAVLCLLVQCEIVRSQGQGTVYTVGDKKGWDLDFKIMNWPNNKHFKEGDVLVFKSKNQYGVAKVDAKEFQQCQTNNETKRYYSGNDKFTLQKGSNYFISTVPDYCGYGMRIKVDVL